MDKFSLYDFMSYFLPGVIGVLFFYKLFPDTVAINKYADFINGLLFTIVAILAGVVLHAITFILIESRWYKWITMQPIEKIIASNATKIKSSVIALQQNFSKQNLTQEQLFNEAYYFLEYNDKITAAKSFQSIYFFLRNLITLFFLIVPISLFMYFYADATLLKQSYCKYAVLGAIAILVLPVVAHFYRTKMVERVFNTYHIALKTKEK
jgi:hypothetical protein